MHVGSKGQNQRGKREHRDTGMIPKDKHENYYLRHLGHLTFDFFSESTRKLTLFKTFNKKENHLLFNYLFWF